MLLPKNLPYLFLACILVVAGCKPDAAEPVVAHPPLLDAATGWETVAVINNLEVGGDGRIKQVVRDLEVVGDSIGLLLCGSDKLYYAKSLASPQATQQKLFLKPVSTPNLFNDNSSRVVLFRPNSFSITRGVSAAHYSWQNLQGFPYSLEQPGTATSIEPVYVKSPFINAVIRPYPSYGGGFHVASLSNRLSSNVSYGLGFEKVLFGRSNASGNYIRIYNADSTMSLFSQVSSISLPSALAYAVIAQTDGNLIIADPLRDGPKGSNDPFIVAQLFHPIFKHDVTEKVDLFCHTVGNSVFIIASTSGNYVDGTQNIHVFRWDEGNSQISHLYKMPSKYGQQIPTNFQSPTDLYSFDDQGRFYTVVRFWQDEYDGYQAMRVGPDGAVKIAGLPFIISAEAQGAVRVFNNYLYTTVQSVDTMASKRQLNVVRYKLPD